MLELLRQRAAAAGVANLECVQAGFLSYRHAGPPADAVYTRNALHQLPDFWKRVGRRHREAFADRVLAEAELHVPGLAVRVVLVGGALQ